MSIVPFNNENAWDPETFFSSLDMWDPFHDPAFPFTTSRFPSLFRSTHGTQFSHKETPRAHIFRAVIPGRDSSSGALVYIDDDNMLEISSEDGGFVTKFKVPDNSRRDLVQTSMVNGVLTVVVPKESGFGSTPGTRNVRNIEISGSG